MVQQLGRSSADRSAPVPGGHAIPVHVAVFTVLTAACLWLSWRKWADPVTDFGRELYLPWRMAEGAVLYRDVDDFYGPLSQHLNAGLFRVFGPGVMVLVTANLAVFAGIVALLYGRVRRGWGPTAALAGVAGFIVVFGFSRFLYAGNFTYAAPYAHETTHGFLVTLALIAALERWVDRGGIGLSATAGLLFGLTWVLKPEFILAGAAAVAVALGLRARARAPWRAGWGLAAALAAVLPTAVFAWHFARHLGTGEAWSAAGRAWLNVVGTTRYLADPAQAGYSGWDAPLSRALGQLGAVSVAAGAVVLLVSAARWLERRELVRRPVGWAGWAVLTAGAALVPSGLWMESGRCLVAAMVAYVAWTGWRAWKAREGDASAGTARLLTAVVALALLARMALHPRVYHFGYYQAALAAVVAVAFLVAELPGRVTVTAGGRRWLAGAVAAVLLPAVIALVLRSAETYRALTLPVGEGRDRFFTYGAAEPLARIAGQLKSLPSQTTLLVLPEGLMLNYLPRLRSPVAPFFFYSAVTEHGGEARLVRELEARPPDFVITVPRDLTEYGIRMYGERSGAGADLMRWVAANYHGAPGDPPPRYRSDAIQVFQRNPTVTR